MGRTVTSALVVSVLAAIAVVLGSQLPALGAGGLLHPGRRSGAVATPDECVEAVFEGAGVMLEGWRCSAQATRRGTVVYLHGVADTRASGAGVIPRFSARGFDVLAYDSRAHGGSEGDACTYGYFEKEDLRRVLDTLEGPIVLIGTSLGAAVALQHAARDRRVSAVVAAETFSDLRTVVTERAPFVFTAGALGQAFALAEQRAGFVVDQVSPVLAAAEIAAPVLLIHGEDDRDTPPSHSQRVFDALAGPKRLLLVPGAIHNASLQPQVWTEIETWIDDMLRLNQQKPTSPCRYEENCECVVPGIPVRWHAAYCMTLNETDDLENDGVSRCLAQPVAESVQRFGACEQNAHWKRLLCRARFRTDNRALACEADATMIPLFVEFGPGAQ